MEIVSLIVKIVDKYAVEPARRQVGYLTHCKSKLEKLQTEVDKLSAARERLVLKVVEAEERGETIHTDVQNWRKDADKITEEANELRKPDTQAKMSCLRGVCPNPVLRYKLGRTSTKLKQAVVELVELYAKTDFSSISYNVRPQEVSVVSDKHYEAFDSRISIVKEIMDELRIPNTDLILVYGIGGVGKTTLVEQVLRQAVKEKLFADAVMVRSVQNPDLEGIQKEIARKLGMEVQESETLSVRAPHLCNRVKDKKVLVILDNIWESIDLEAVGLPCLPNCRILLTSRTRKLLSSEKRLQKDFELRVLNENEAWRLFETKAGDVVKNPDIRIVATDVAKKCGGLPLLVVTVASSLRNRSTLPVWKNAFGRLKVFDNEDPAEQEAYSALEWSYNQLDDQKLKRLFLICGIMVNRSAYANLTDLLKYTIGLGLFKNFDSVEDARYALHAWIEELKDSALLLDTENNTLITMHDLLRDVAISIASKGHGALVRARGDVLKEWPNNKDFSENCTMISLSCRNIPRLPEVLKCQQLEYFYLYFNNEIPGNFFEEMKELKVMGLTGARISSLPPSLLLLENLRTLCLDHCVLGDITLVGQLLQLEILSFINSKFEELPQEIGKLTRLRLLDLKDCYKLKVISPNVISRLTSLEDLRMKNSFNRWVPEGVTGERSNASLSELKDLPRLAALSIHVPDAGSIPRNLFTDKLKRYQILIGASNWYGVDETLNTLKLKLPTGCVLDHGLEMLLKRSCEDLYLDGSEGADNVVYHSNSEDFQQLKHLDVQNNAQCTHIITEEVVLRNLITLVVRDCNSLTFVLSSSMAGNRVSMEEIVSTKEYGCSALKGIGSSAISFQNLTTLEVVGCCNLKYLATYTIAKTLKRLRAMRVGRCERMTEIGATTSDGDDAGNYGEISFCQLKSLSLSSLPSLQDFFSGNCIVKFPSLKTVNIYECPKLKINSFEWKSSPELQGVQITEDYLGW
ncbi:probable disease resistance protein At4g27220 [Pyrus x bretschneideri]|uniref:probable disease resistance protein At4g27220 n=1 Tax=Pyrus x bretschneideri TaxID=225117 RepID=UPI00202ED7C1|nr:probable disease resistance protein At4g27220 [Pyrus x bretschneideri]XP_048444396.1 probable disease resistance protein At4g27220 [Pyrus x bretschneideri]XP_048444397.1 probable disease resistance protein At4g27220 [Pyrus x bretschneideri]